MEEDLRIQQLLDLLDTLYPWNDKCFLHYETPWQLLFATILSAQCTDDRVNLVTKTLFKKYPDLKSFAEAPLEVLEQDVRSTGFYRMKALHIKESARVLLETHNGAVPSDMEALTALPGVGRKTANLVRGHIYRIPGVVVDTHVKRVSYKLGLTRHTDPERVEYELREKLPQTHWIRFNAQIITHGRQVCSARNPKCQQCALSGLCAAYGG